jgi:alpha-D-ribose 1-methylphosphonate 5-triphosphate synthase subunit PhnG
VSDTVTTPHHASPIGARENSSSITPEHLFEGLAQANADEVVELADRILQTPATVGLVAGPTVVSSPLRLETPGDVGTAVIGHIAMTSCEVSLEGTRGDAIRSGRSLEASIAAAICDAEVQRGGIFANEVIKLAESTMHVLNETQARRSQATRQTRIGTEV